MALGVQPAGVHKMRVRHAQLGRLLVHHLGKRRFRAAHKFGHRHSGVVGRAHADGLHQFVQRELLARLQPNLAAAHVVGVLGDGHDVCHGYLARLHGLQRKQQRHHLGDGGNGHLVVRLHLVQNVACVGAHQKRVAARQRKRGRLHAGGKHLVRVAVKGIWLRRRGPVCGWVCRALGTLVRRAPCGGVRRALGGRVCCAARRGRGRGAGGQAVRPHGRAGRAQHQGRQNACGNFLFHHQHPPIGLLARRRAAHPSPAMFAPAHGESPCGRGAKGAARPVRRWQSTLSI